MLQRLKRGGNQYWKEEIVENIEGGTGAALFDAELTTRGLDLLKKTLLPNNRL